MSDRATAAARGYDAKWRRTRGRYLKHHPTCEQDGCEAPAIEVHHLDGRGPPGPAGHKWFNLQALCKPHHSKVTALEQPGGWAARPSRRRPPEQHPGRVGGTPNA